jgi:DNA repair protein RecN (Recombination protein N)
VYKANSRTNISVLDCEQRVMEIAKMLSGSEITDAALTQAKLLLEKK